MKTYLHVPLAIFLLNVAVASERPWQELSDPRVAEVASNFKTPPAEYSMTFYWGWDGPVTEEVIARDLKEYSSKNVRAVTIEAGYRMNTKYLSPEWFALVKYTVEQARRNNMRVWLVDEGKYPSGFAGGKFSELRPDLTMQTFRVADRFAVNGGETGNRPVKDNTICAVAVNEVNGTSKVLELKNGQLN